MRPDVGTHESNEPLGLGDRAGIFDPRCSGFRHRRSRPSSLPRPAQDIRPPRFARHPHVPSRAAARYRGTQENARLRLRDWPDRTTRVRRSLRSPRSRGLQGWQRRHWHTKSSKDWDPGGCTVQYSRSHSSAPWHFPAANKPKATSELDRDGSKSDARRASVPYAT